MFNAPDTHFVIVSRTFGAPRSSAQAYSFRIELVQYKGFRTLKITDALLYLRW